MDRMKYADVYRSGTVRRFHNNPELGGYGQNNAAHTWGVVTLLFMLHPNPTLGLISAAQMHDVGEYVVGDLPGPYKRRNRAVADAHAATEDEARMDMLDGAFEVETELDRRWIKFCDWLEACLFVLVHRPDHMRHDGWTEMLDGVLEEAAILGVHMKTANLVASVSR